MKCRALCSSQDLINKAGRPCNQNATVEFKDKIILCGRHASKRLLYDAIGRGSVTLLPRVATPPSICTPLQIAKLSRRKNRRKK